MILALLTFETWILHSFLTNAMNDDDPRTTDDGHGPWWRLDFTMLMMLLILAAILLFLTSELWHTHFDVH